MGKREPNNEGNSCLFQGSDFGNPGDFGNLSCVSLPTYVGNTRLVFPVTCDVGDHGDSGDRRASRAPPPPPGFDPIRPQPTPHDPMLRASAEGRKPDFGLAKS
jgi:hypothetical protein